MPPAPEPGASGADAPGPDPDGPLEIPYAIRWLVPRGERFANFDILNDNDTQLEYYRRFGHIYAVGIPAKKWRLVVVSDPNCSTRWQPTRSGSASGWRTSTSSTSSPTPAAAASR